jgi:hypothetical protein
MDDQNTDPNDKGYGGVFALFAACVVVGALVGMYLA